MLTFLGLGPIAAATALLTTTLHLPALLLVIASCNAATVMASCRNKNLGDNIDYAQQQYDCLGELISDTLALFEQRGGEDAFINIKYMVRTPYQPCRMQL